MIGTFLTATITYFIVYTIYPLPILRIYYSFFSGLFLSIIFPNSKMIFNGFIFGITYLQKDYLFKLEIGCTVPEFWTFFIGFCFLFPGYSLKQKLKRFLIIFCCFHALHLFFLIIQEVLFIATSIPWFTIHGSIITQIVEYISNFGIVYYIIFKYYPDFHKILQYRISISDIKEERTDPTKSYT